MRGERDLRRSSIELCAALAMTVLLWGCTRAASAPVHVADAPLSHATLVLQPALPVSPPLPPATSIACGNEHSCALLSEGRVVCWGANEHGELGPSAGSDGAYGELRVPGAEAIVASGWRTCARLGDGSHSCWGKGFKGQLVSFPPIQRARFLLGAYAVLLLRSPERELILWPGNGAAPPPVGQSTYSLLTSLPGAGEVQVVGGSFAYLAVSTSDGSLSCLPKEERSLLCPGVRAGAWSTTKAVNARQLVAAEEHLCVLRETGDVSCAGLDVYRTNPGPPPVFQPIPLPRPAAGIAGSNGQTCALLEGGELSCWQVTGIAGVTTFGPAVSLSEVGRARAIAGGREHVCALDESGAIACFGSNLHGQVSPAAPRTGFGSIRRVRLAP